MKSSRPITAVIITYNESENIADCIKSLKDIVKEVIVIDANSVDETIDIAKGLGAKVFTKDWTTYGDQKNFGSDQASFDWVLSIDADERVDVDLKEELLNLELQENYLYSINVKTNYLGKWIRYCGWYPSYKKRLYNKSAVRWNSDLVHEALITQGDHKHSKLQGNLLHYSYPTIERHHQKIERYAKLTAQKWMQQKKAPSILKKIFGPSFRFIKTYILRLGILDGKEGFMISKMSFLLVKEQLRYFKQIKQRS